MHNVEVEVKLKGYAFISLQNVFNNAPLWKDNIE